LSGLPKLPKFGSFQAELVNAYFHLGTKVMLTRLHAPDDTHDMDSKPSGAAPGPIAAALTDQRREQRLNVAVPVKVSLTEDSASFQLCCTYEISMVGARLVAVSGVTKVGQVIWLQRHSRRAKYKVIWIGQQGTSQANQVGVEVLEPASVIWENELRVRIRQK
jgi:hypothetical protein